jgi:hypothetical protein
LEDINPEYAAFVDKFKPKKTTDDCYTPKIIYDTVLEWIRQEYTLGDKTIICRPFWPGGDFERYDYPAGSIVIDNPPFSIISKICRTYLANGIRFFLFAPYLTCLNICPDEICHIVTGSDIEYENGAIVKTSFVTNLEGTAARTAPELSAALKSSVAAMRKQTKKELPKYNYPDNVVTATMLGGLSSKGIEYKLARPVAFIRGLDAKRTQGKTIFGGGYLISEKAAAEKAAAEKAAAEKAAAEKAAAEKAAATVWQLSEREKVIVDSLGGGQ